VAVLETVVENVIVIEICKKWTLNAKLRVFTIFWLSNKCWIAYFLNIVFACFFIALKPYKLNNISDADSN